MSAELRHQVQELLHTYCDAVVHADEARWASTWAVNAFWSLPGGRDVQGRDAIVELWRTSMAKYRLTIQTTLSGTVRLGDNDFTATGRWYIQESAWKVDGEPTVLHGYYDDEYLRTESGWKFARRTLTLLHRGAPDLRGS
ncbi:MAG: nuclear transport factor 2 family protein [Ilumatobacteraceae bacterium]